MTTQIMNQVAKIAKLENENSTLLKELETIRNEEQIVVSKKGEIENKLTFKRTEVQEAWEILKELIVKGNIKE